MRDFDAAATRHYQDATLLDEHGRLPNADQLAGFATECALKAILIGFLGAQQTQGKPVSMIGGQSKQHGHLPPLWEETVLVVAGRAAATAFASLLGGPNPFSSWSASDRYEDGGAVTAQLVTNHLGVARLVLGQLQNAKALGVLQ